MATAAAMRTSVTGTSGARLAELDAIRGVAAMAVSLQHVLNIAGAVGAVVAVIGLTPLNAFVDGTRAVLLFFVLSGFVLAIPFFHLQVSPLGFVAKRAARLYPAYWLALVISIAVYAMYANPHLSLFSVANYASLVTEYDAQRFNVVFWSLVQEMRISILFPLLIVPIVLVRSRWILLASTLLIAVGFLGEEGPGGPIIGLPATAYYAFFFVIGAVTAKHIDQLAGVIRRMSAVRLGVWLGLLLVVYGSLPVLGLAVPVEKAAVGVACAGIMVVSIGWDGLSGLLRSPGLQFLGRVSYSYYLLHVPVSDVVNRMTGGPGLVAAAVTIAASLLAAWASYRWIEAPGIRLGHALYTRISGWAGGRRELHAESAVPVAADAPRG